MDLATQNKTRSSCTRVEVEVYLLGEFPKRINIGMRKKTGEVVEKWIPIKYDYVPKYCTECKLQGHNKKKCYIIHSELYPKKEKKEMAETEENIAQKGEDGQRKQKQHRRQK